MVAHKNALQRLWRGRCTVYVKAPDSVPDPSTGRTSFTEQAVAVNAPCHLAFSNAKEAIPAEGAAKITQTGKLFLDPAVPLPPGSKLSITQNGITGCYVQSGEAAVYPNHKEIVLKGFERWA